MKYFCAAPFVHLYVNSGESDSKVCCVAQEHEQKNPEHEADLSLLWKSDGFKSIRKEMLGVDTPTDRIRNICFKCINKETNSGKSDRTWFNETYDYIVPNVNTGNQFNGPIDFDLRPGNLCNLQCRMCYSGSSSQIEKEIKNGKTQLLMFMGKPKVDIFELGTEKNINFILQNIKECKRIKFLGGEPTIMPEVHQLMDMLIENNITDIPISITTNLTNSNEKFIEKLSNFSRIHFNYSIDGIGSTVEYIRYPVKWDSIVKNIKVYEDIANTSAISFALQAYNIHNFKEFIDWTKSINKLDNLNVVEVTQPEWDNIYLLPVEYREKYLKDIDLNIAQHILTQSDRCDTIQKNKFIRHTKILDESRKHHIKDYLPELWELIEEEYNAVQI